MGAVNKYIKKGIKTNVTRNMAAVLAVMSCIALTGCADSDRSQPDAVVSLENDLQNEEKTQSVSIEGSDEESGIQTESVQTDAGLEEELEQYRREREALIQEANGLVEGGTPDEDAYSFDLSGTFYESQFDTKELTEAYAAARIYVTDTLQIQPGTKRVIYMCIDPRVTAIYDDEDKGVAAGYDNSNIFVCEYCDASGVWKYLILTREGKGSAWNVLHNGDGYRR